MKNICESKLKIFFASFEEREKNDFHYGLIFINLLIKVTGALNRDFTVFHNETRKPMFR